MQCSGQELFSELRQTISDPFGIINLILRHFENKCLIEIAIKSMAGTADCITVIGRAPDSYVRGPGFDTRSSHILSSSFRFFKKGSCQLLATVCAQSTG